MSDVQATYRRGTGLPGPNGATTRTAERVDDAFFRPVFTGRRMWLNRIGIAVWIASLFFFWQWWFDPQHVASVSRYVLVTVVLLWVTLIPVYFVVIFSRARIPVEPASVPSNARVAMIVTKAPSEPLSVVKQTLKAALAQKGVAHDTWLADEDPTPETLSWCAEHGIRVSTRRGVKDYHRPDWPRRTRCKEGNLAYFYDHYGYENYDFVSQFDADHAPDPEYLRHAVAPFRDPSVGYVSAPSICDTNADLSWAARGRLFVEASMHGALQTGYNSGWAPLCIGSHYTVRTAALKQVGGLGPELAEDHSTTLLMNAGGWRGVHAVDAIAHGEGPETFADLAVQEFQWSRSLVTILLKYSPDYVPNLSGRIRFQFLFSQMWYPLFSVMMALMFFLPIYALLSGEKFANVTFLEFQLHVLPVGLALIFLAYFWRSTGLFRPRDARIISWEGMAFMFLRWPWSLLGALAALWDVATGQKRDFKITPKGGSHKEGLSFLFLAPYVVLALAAGGTALVVREPGTAAGFYLYNLVNAAAYCVLLVVILMRHGRENGTAVVSFDRSGLAGVFCLFLIAGVVGGATYQHSAKGVSAMMTGVSAFSLTETVFGFAGAGQGSGRTIIRYRVEWRGFGQAETQTVPMDVAPPGQGRTSLDSKQ